MCANYHLHHSGTLIGQDPTVQYEGIAERPYAEWIVATFYQRLNEEHQSVWSPISVYLKTIVTPRVMIVLVWLIPYAPFQYSNNPLHQIMIIIINLLNKHFFKNQKRQWSMKNIITTSTLGKVKRMPSKPIYFGSIYAHF